MDEIQWFVLRDLKRPNAKLPAYKRLEALGMEYFTPMVHKLVSASGKREERLVPYMPDLLFVKDTREHLDTVIETTPKLQYRYKYGVRLTPMTVPSAEMERFINAARSGLDTRYYSPEQVTPEMRGRRIRIIGGALDGYEGTLVTTRGSKTKRLLVELPAFLAAAVEVRPEFITFL